jgi:DNA-binding transcriptional regulator YhcF (GntR family)
VYQQLADDLRRRIGEGEFRPGERLPAVQQFAAEYQVDKNTVVRAYEALEAAGVVERDASKPPMVLGLGFKPDRQRIEDLEAHVGEIQALRRDVDELQAQVADLYHSRGEHAPSGLRGREAARGSRPG